MPALLHRVAAWLLLTLLVLGVAGGGHPAVQAEDSAAATAGRGKTRPVLLLPGFASSQLQSWSHRRCEKGFRKNLYRDVNIGDRLWIDIGRVLAQSDCWMSCMQLHTANQSEVDCKLRAGEGLDAISELDPGLVTGPLSTVWRDIIKDLVQHFHLGPDQLIVAPYDWRLPPSKLQERDRYFYQLMKKIEYTVDLNGGDALVVIAHSMGNNMLRYFLAWLKLEIGVNHWQEWIDKHISAYFAVGAPLLGSAEALELITSGVTNGLPVSLSAIRQMVVSFGSILGFMPIPAATDSALDDDTLISVRFHEGLDYHGESIDRTVNYSSKEIASGQFFRDLAPHDPIFQDLETVRQKFYVEDEVVDQLSPWDRPPIKSVYAIYGVNVPTRYNYQYQHKTDADDWYMMEVAHEEGPDMLCGKTGDGTVPYHSLSWSHSWFGQQTTSVSVTQTPQSVYFSAGDIRRVRAVRNDTAHHAQYEQAGSGKSLCDADDSEGGSWTGGAGSAGNEGFFNGLFGSSADNQITFYESTEETAAGIRSTSVWEIDGARHREILSNSAFLRELRMELRNIFNDGVTADKTSRPPMIDTDCYWNYRRAQCEFPDFCEYRYNFGDVVLDQSCRIRPTNKLLTAPSHVATIAPVLDMATLTKAADSVVVPITTSRPSYMPASSSCGMYNECTALA